MRAIQTRSGNSRGLVVPPAIALLFAGVCVTQPAGAEETKTSKPYIDASVGPGISFGPTAPAFTLGVMPAYAFSPSFALGLGIDAELLFGFSNGKFVGLAAASAVAVFRNGTGFEWALGVGAETVASFATSCDGSGGCDDSGTVPLGPRFGIRAGYVWPSGFGLALNASVAVIADGDKTYTHGVLAPQGTFASW